MSILSEICVKFSTMNNYIEIDTQKNLNVTEISGEDSSFVNNSDFQAEMDECPVNSEIENSEVSPGITEYPVDANEENDWLDILGSGGIMKKTIVEGKSGTQPTKNEICTIQYTCSLENGTIVESANNYTLSLGESDVSSRFYIKIIFRHKLLAN